MPPEKNHLAWDIGLILLGTLFAIVMAKIGAVDAILRATGDWKLLTSFVAGIFFTSAFSTVPAMVVLFELMKSSSIGEVAIVAAIGAVLGDLAVFLFAREKMEEDIRVMMSVKNRKRLSVLIDKRLFRFLTIFLGALVIASPLPDEVGLAMLGFSKMKTKIFIPVSFLFNFVGIVIIGFLAQSGI